MILEIRLRPQRRDVERSQIGYHWDISLRNMENLALQRLSTQ
jgi:hypothetical protein